MFRAFSFSLPPPRYHCGPEVLFFTEGQDFILPSDHQKFDVLSLLSSGNVKGDVHDIFPSLCLIANGFLSSTLPLPFRVSFPLSFFLFLCCDENMKPMKFFCFSFSRMGIGTNNSFFFPGPGLQREIAQLFRLFPRTLHGRFFSSPPSSPSGEILLPQPAFLKISSADRMRSLLSPPSSFAFQPFAEESANGLAVLISPPPSNTSFFCLERF